MVEISLNHVSIFLSRIEIDPNREAAEIEKSLHLGADPGPQAKDGPALPGNVQCGQPFPQCRPEFGIVIRKIMGLELRLLVFQIRFVRVVTAALKCALRSPHFAEFANENTFADGALQPGEKPKRIKGALFFPAHQKSEPLGVSRYFESKVSTPCS